MMLLSVSTKLDRATCSKDYAPVASAQSISSPPLHPVISGLEHLFLVERMSKG